MIAVVVGRSALLYIVVQSGGAIVGALILKLLREMEMAGMPQMPQKDLLCTPTPLSGMSAAQVFGYELLITFIFVLTVFASCDTNRTGIGGSGPLAIGLAISMCHLWAVRTDTYLYVVTLLSTVAFANECCACPATLC